MVKVGIIGLGTVAGSALEIILEGHDRILAKTGVDLVVDKVAVRNRSKERRTSKPVSIVYDAFEIINDPEIRIVLEATSGDPETAAEYIRQSLAKGKNVVTPGKAAVGKYWNEFHDLAKANNVHLLIEGSAGGVVPAFFITEDYLSCDKISSIRGIVNGTTNFIFTKMAQEGMEFEDALKLAQEKGYAEIPPDYDVLCLDHASKIANLASAAWGTYVDPRSVYREGITEITKWDFRFAKERGYAIKVFASAKRHDGCLDVRVHPVITKDKIMSNVDNAKNAIQIVGEYSGEMTFIGAGAGPETGVALVHDIILAAVPYVRKGGWVEDLKINQDGISTAGYFRMMLKDEPDVLSQAAHILAENGLSIDEHVQYKDSNRDDAKPWLVMVKCAPEYQIKSAMSQLEGTIGSGPLVEKPFFMRVG